MSYGVRDAFRSPTPSPERAEASNARERRAALREPDAHRQVPYQEDSLNDHVSERDKRSTYSDGDTVTGPAAELLDRPAAAPTERGRERILPWLNDGVAPEEMGGGFDLPLRPAEIGLGSPPSSIDTRRSDRSDGSIRREEEWKKKVDDLQRQNANLQRRLAAAGPAAPAPRQRTVPAPRASASTNRPRPRYTPPAPSRSYRSTPTAATPSFSDEKLSITRARAESPGLKAVFPRAVLEDVYNPSSFEMPDTSYEIWKRWRDLNPRSMQGIVVSDDDGERFQRTAAAPTRLGEKEKQERRDGERKDDLRKREAQAELDALNNFRGYNEHGGLIED
jgi:hypothetical protein